MTARVFHLAEAELDQAYSAYLTQAARVDEILETAATRLGPDAPARLRDASLALDAERASTAALAWTIAAAATSEEIKTAAETVRAADTACAVALAAIGLTRPARLRQAGERLLAAAVAVAFPTAPTLAVAS